MVKHTETICRQKLTNVLSLFDHFMELALKGLLKGIILIWLDSKITASSKLVFLYNFFQRNLINLITSHCTKNEVFHYGFLQSMWPNPQETADLVTFTEEIRNGKLHFLCSECSWNSVSYTNNVASLHRFLKPSNFIPVYGCFSFSQLRAWIL